MDKWGITDVSVSNLLRAISVILGDKWKKMKNEERRLYTMEAKALAEEQKRLNPDCWKRKRTNSVSIFELAWLALIIVNLFLKDKIWLTLILSSFSLALRSLRIWNWSLNHIPLHFARALSRTSLRIVTKTRTGRQETDTDTHSLKRMINRNCDASRTCFREKNKQIKFANYNETSLREELQKKKYIWKNIWTKGKSWYNYMRYNFFFNLVN